MIDKRVLTLYYHRVNTLKTDYNLLCVSPVKFRQQLLYLKQNYQIVSFKDDWNLINGDAVCVTFDDGYYDNLKYGLPIIEELKIPVTIFISTGNINQEKELWWDELERLILADEYLPSTFQLIDDEFGCIWNMSTWEQRKNSYAGIHYLMKNFINPERRENWLRQLWNWHGLKRSVRETHRTLSLEDCKKIAKSKWISIGAHTISHPSLAMLSNMEQAVEIEESIVKLSEILDTRITLFSYPFGLPDIDFNIDTIKTCQKYGIEKAASTENAIWNPTVNPYKIPRKVVRDWDLNTFDRMIRQYWNE